MTASIKDVAKKAGVSAGTVSNVFSGNRVVRADLVERVREAARELGYQPDRAASQLRAGKARIVAALVPDLNNPFFTSLIASIESSLRADGMDIIVASSNDDPAEERTRLAALLAWRPAALIAIPCADEFASRDLVDKAGIPYVVVDRVPHLFEGDAVTVDNPEAGRMAADHLIGLGHRNIVVVASTMKLRNIRERCEGIEQVFTDHGLGRPTLIEVGLDFETASERLADFMEGERQATAFLALTNFATLGVLASLHQRGRRVPEDVSVLGFDDYSWMRAVNPPLTAIRQPVEEMGRMAWLRLRERIAGEDVPFSRMRLNCKLMVRTSTAPAVGSPQTDRPSSAGRSAPAKTG
ncbi:LacI family DNA-binding transcriptional regulator [Mesorhizobium sp. CN5-321]|uniref:LacI family DNA-binding transcriptional regulator n=1 Tax=Mesorhizobium hunchu TaxID=3157708 RepID=UPI0032B82CE6